jgi:TatD DNase family protein
MLIDTHSHLHFHKSFPDYQEVLERAELAGVSRQILIGCDLHDSLKACELAGKYAQLNWVMGIHPHEANQINSENLRTMRDILTGKGEFSGLAKLPVAIGEIGLDYYRNLQPVEDQQRGFRQLLELAKEFGLPVVIHMRDAFEDGARIMEESGIKNAVLHCFSGSMKEADWAWARGFMVSFTGVVTYPKNTALMEVARMAPPDKYMLETDCPFLAPQVHRGKRCEPAFVRDIAVHVAELRGETLEKVARETTANGERFFSLSSLS